MDVTRRLAELETLNAIGEICNREPDFGAAAQQVLDRLVDLVEVTTGWLFLARLEHGDPHYSSFRLAASTGVPPALQTDGCTPLRAGSCECQGRFRRAELDTGVNVVTCSRLDGAAGDTRGLVFHASVPLQGRGSPVGILNLAAPGTAPFDSETLALLTAVGRQLGVAYERARLLAERRREAAHVAAMEERGRVAREIHDSVTQLLFGADLALRTARDGRDPATAVSAVERGAGLVESALGELRGLVELMRSADLDQGLYPALARLVQRTSGAVAVHLDAEPVAVPDEVAEACYRIVQEALHNALKHADATNIWVHLAVDGGTVRLTVEDDGRGLPDPVPRGVGLESIAGRVSALDGTMTLGRGQRGGASLTVEVPCRPAC